MSLSQGRIPRKYFSSFPNSHMLVFFLFIVFSWVLPRKTFWSYSASVCQAPLFFLASIVFREKKKKKEKSKRSSELLTVVLSPASGLCEAELEEVSIPTEKRFPLLFLCRYMSPISTVGSLYAINPGTVVLTVIVRTRIHQVYEDTSKFATRVFATGV